jgi:cytochrome c553
MKGLLKWTAVILGGLILLTVLGGLGLYPKGIKKLSMTYPDIPVEIVDIPGDPDAIAHGQHVATIWACTKCHGDHLSGELVSNNPLPGMLAAANLTSGKGGIGTTYSDTDWVRTIRHGVKPDATAAILMEAYYASMSDLDLGDLIAYLKQLPSVDAGYPEQDIGLLFPIARALGLLTPAAEQIDHDTMQPAAPMPGATVEYGGYLWPLCNECHSSKLISNLQKDDWTQEDFIRAMQTGFKPDSDQFGKTMSSKIFSELTDMELSALWLFMQTLPAGE